MKKMSLIGISILILLLVASCLSTPKQTLPQAPPSNVPSEAGLPITLKMSFPNGAPALNQEAHLSCQVNARVFPAKNMEVHINLPEALELVEGNLSWIGDVIKGDKGDKVEVINVTVKAVEVGNYTIDGTTTLNPDEHGAFGGGRHSIYVSISEDTAEWRNYPPYSDLTPQHGVMGADPDITEDYPEPPSAPPPAPTPAPEKVVFPDKNLEEAIRDALDKPEGDITPAELAGLAVLHATDRSITDLSGIEYCTNLTALYLGANRINDISALSSLVNLTDLMLAFNKVSDFSPLSKCTKLTNLYLAWNQRSDISALSSLTNLTQLDLSGNKISDISALVSLTKLVSLTLWDNQISDISELVSLSRLTSLDLSENQISDIRPLSHLINLTNLSLKLNSISDISALSSLTSLRNLSIAGNKIEDISPLLLNKGLGKGDEIRLEANPLSADSVNTYIPQLRQRGVNVILQQPEHKPAPAPG